jgi:hypothetical protein
MFGSPCRRLQIPLPIEGASVEVASVEGPKASLAPLGGEGTGLVLQTEGEGRRVVAFNWWCRSGRRRC